MNKKVVFLATAALLLGGFGAFNLMKEEPYAKLEVVSGSAAFEHFDSIEKLEKDSDLVVLATFTGKREMYERKNEEGRTIVKLSKSTLEIEKVFKGNAQKKDGITVFEEGYMWDKDRYVTTEHYKWMHETGKYLLFLNSQPINDTYVINGIYQGKYDVNIKKQAKEHKDSKDAFLDPEVEYLGSDFELENFYKLKQQAVKKYGL